MLVACYVLYIEKIVELPAIGCPTRYRGACHGLSAASGRLALWLVRYIGINRWGSLMFNSNPLEAAPNFLQFY